MTRAEIDAICAALPGATEAHPPELVSWKVGGKMFACFGGDGEMNGVSVKTDSTETAAMLIDAGAAIRAPYFHRSWVRLPFETTDPDEARHRLAVSYDLVRASLKKAQRDALPVREATP
ncbi:MAG: MmcQ/YjbR family DNA-binding protein [Pseudomonadota bacterium]